MFIDFSSYEKALREAQCAIFCLKGEAESLKEEVEEALSILEHIIVDCEDIQEKMED